MTPTPQAAYHTPTQAVDLHLVARTFCAIDLPPPLDRTSGLPSKHQGSYIYHMISPGVTFGTSYTHTV